MLEDPELAEILNSGPFTSLKITKYALEKTFEYGRILEGMVGYPREYRGYLIKSRDEKREVATDIYLAYTAESSASHVRFDAISDFMCGRELKSLGYETIGEYHYHGTHAAIPSPRDEKERNRILNSSLIKRFYPKRGVRSEGKLLGSKTTEKFGVKKIVLETDNPFLNEIEIRTEPHKTLFDRLFKHHPKITKNARKVLRYLLKNVGPDIIDFEDIRDGKMDFTIRSSLGIGYAYQMITNHNRQKYAELLYTPICRSCGPLGLRYKPVSIEVMNNQGDIQFDENKLRRELNERVLSPIPDFEAWKKSVGL